MSSNPQAADPGGKPQTAKPENAKQVAIQKIYVRDASLEVPGGPGVFAQEWKPTVDVQLNTGVQELKNDLHHVVLTVTVKTKLGEQVAYLAEVQQAGIFLLRGFGDAEEKRAVLGAYCPNILFPFARETIADQIRRAGFPEFLLQPVNFDALYQQHVVEARKQTGSAVRH